MAVPPAPHGAVGEHSPDPTVPTHDPRTTARWRSWLLVGLTVVIVGCLASLVVVLLDRRDAGATGADSPQAQREELMARTSQFVLRINTYGPQMLDAENRMPDYVSGVSELMTAKFAAGFTESVVIPEQQVAQTGYGRAAEVYAVGVSTMDADSATALVAFGRTDSYPDPKAPNKKRVDLPEDPERWQVELVLSDGEWLVDDYTVIAEAPQTEGDPQDLPSGTPVPGASPGSSPESDPGTSEEAP